jgi:hypothetical protein
MNWYYVDGPLRVGPLSEVQWAELVRSGKIQPNTLVWHEALTKWTPYSELPPEIPPEPEPASPLAEEAAETGVETPEAFAARMAERPFTVGITSGIAESWQLLKSNFWMLVGSTLLVYVLIYVGSSIPVLAMAMPLALNGVLMGGLYVVYLRLMRGGSATVSDLFSGFAPGAFRNLALETLVTFLVIFACFIPLVIAVGVAGAASLTTAGADVDPMTAMVILLIGLACSMPAVYFSFCWIFAVPLVIDKGLPFWPAMKLSRRKVLQHPWRISLLLTLAGLIASLPSIVVVLWALNSGSVELTVGPEAMEKIERIAGIAKLSTTFTEPLYIGALLYLYRQMFGDGAEEAAPKD